ncbi:MAG: bis(5'-nucleosyl)-tetraphosphatase (symmetrical), partial [Burkholderiaceae bacterium]
FLTPDGVMDFDTKDGAGTPPAGHVPWFDVPGRRTEDVTVVFGHWSTLGLLLRPNLVGLDTGCVWGGALTGVNLATRAVTQVPCPRARDPAGH